MSENKEIIERMKDNWTAWGGLTEEECECFRDNQDHVELLQTGYTYSVWRKRHTKVSHRPYNVYRISPDWKPDEEPNENPNQDQIDRMTRLRDELNISIKELS